MSRTNINPATGLETPEIERREFLKIGGIGLGSLALTGGVVGIAVTETGCAAPKDLALWVQIGTSAFTELKALLPQLGLGDRVPIVEKGIAALNDVLSFFKANKFTDALSALNAIVAPNGLFNQLANDVGLSSPKVGTILIAVNGALRIIAIILQAKVNATPAAAAAVSASKAAKNEDGAKVSNVEALTNPAAINKALQVLRF